MRYHIAAKKTKKRRNEKTNEISRVHVGRGDKEDEGENEEEYWGMLQSLRYLPYAKLYTSDLVPEEQSLEDEELTDGDDDIEEFEEEVDEELEPGSAREVWGSILS